MAKVKLITEDEWLSNFKKINTKPDGWYTIFDISKKTGMSETSVRRRIKKMIINDEVDVIDCIIGKNILKCYKNKVAKK